jgi:HK97 gp10 family phage protein
MTSEASADISKLAQALQQTAAQSHTTTMDVLIQSSNYLRAEMQAHAPVKTGNLRRSIGVEVETDKVTIGPNLRQAPYAGYVEFGTKPHVIKPRKAKALRFTVGGVTVYAKLVHHPGTKAHPYVMPAFTSWVDSLGTMAAEANVKVFTDHAK